MMRPEHRSTKMSGRSVGCWAHEPVVFIFSDGGGERTIRESELQADDSVGLLAPFRYQGELTLPCPSDLAATAWATAEALLCPSEALAKEEQRRVLNLKKSVRSITQGDSSVVYGYILRWPVCPQPDVRHRAPFYRLPDRAGL